MGGQRLAGPYAFLSVAIAGAHPFASFDGHGPEPVRPPEFRLRHFPSPESARFDRRTPLGEERRPGRRNRFRVLPRTRALDDAPLLTASAPHGSGGTLDGKAALVGGGFTKQQIYEQTIPRSLRAFTRRRTLYSPYTRAGHSFHPHHLLHEPTSPRCGRARSPCCGEATARPSDTAACASTEMGPHIRRRSTDGARSRQLRSQRASLRPSSGREAASS